MIVLLWVVLGVGAASPVRAQGTGVENLYILPGRPAMEIYLLGGVSRPGKWRVDTEATLFDVLAVANPTGVGGNQEVKVQLFRSVGATRSLVLDTSLEEIVAGEQATMPLQADDVLRVETIVDRPFSLLQTIQTVSSVAGLVLLIVNIATN